MDFLSTLLQRGILLLKLGVCPECTQAQMCVNTTCLLLGSGEHLCECDKTLELSWPLHAK